MIDAGVNHDPIEVLAVDFIKRQRHGEFLSVPDYARAHPELAEKIRELFPAMLALDALRPVNGRSARKR